MESKTVGMVFLTFNSEQRELAYYLVGYAVENGRDYLVGTGNFDNAKQRELRKIRETLNAEQRLVLDCMVKETIVNFRLGLWR